MYNTLNTIPTLPDWRPACVANTVHPNATNIWLGRKPIVIGCGGHRWAWTRHLEACVCTPGEYEELMVKQGNDYREKCLRMIYMDLTRVLFKWQLPQSKRSFFTYVPDVHSFYQLRLAIRCWPHWVFAQWLILICHVTSNGLMFVLRLMQ